MTQAEITKILELSLCWDQSQHYKNSTIGIYFSEKYHNSFLKTYIDKYKQNNNDVYFIVDSDFYKMNIMINNLNMILITQNEIKEREMKFDYIVMNPPFTGSENGKTTNGAFPAQNNNLWMQIIERMMNLTDNISYIAPKGGLGKFWNKYKEQMIYAERLSFDAFPIGHETVRGTWKKYPSEKERKKCRVKFDKIEHIKISKYPKRIPLIRNGCSLSEYDEVFDQQNGIKQKLSCGKTSGFYREKTELIYEDNVTEDQLCYPCSEDYANIIIPKFLKLMNEEKIHGYYGRGFKNAMRDFDPIKKNLL